MFILHSAQVAALSSWPNGITLRVPSAAAGTFEHARMRSDPEPQHGSQTRSPGWTSRIAASSFETWLGV